MAENEATNETPETPETPASTPGVTHIDPETGEEMVRVRTRQRTGRHRTGRKRKRKGRAKRVVLAVLLVIVVLVAAGAVFAAMTVHSGEESMHATVQKQEELTVKYKGHEYIYNEDVVSVMVEGIDDEGSYSFNGRSCSDANFLVTLDTSSNNVKIVTIPRDSKCKVDVYKDNAYAYTAKTNLCLAYASDADKDTLAENVATSVSRIMEDMPIKYYFAINVHAIADLVDAVDGVELEALQTIPNTNIVKGQTVKLTGETALKYVQWRDTEKSKSSLDRQKRQEQFIKAYLKKLRSLGVSEMLSVVKTVADYTVTNLGTKEMSYLATSFIAGGKGNVEMLTLSGKTKSKVYEEDGLEHEYIVLDKSSVHKAVMATYYKMLS